MKSPEVQSKYAYIIWSSESSYCYISFHGKTTEIAEFETTISVFHTEDPTVQSRGSSPRWILMGVGYRCDRSCKSAWHPRQLCGRRGGSLARRLFFEWKLKEPCDGEALKRHALVQIVFFWEVFLWAQHLKSASIWEYHPNSWVMWKSRTFTKPGILSDQMEFRNLPNLVLRVCYGNAAF